MTKNNNKKWRQCVAGVSLAFAAAAFPAASPPKPAATAPSPEGLWLMQYFNAVIRIKACPATTFCADFYWLDGKDTKIYDHFGDPAEKNNNVFETPRQSDAADVATLCGFSPKFNLKAGDKMGEWTGALELRGSGVDIALEIKQLDNNRIEVTGSKAFVKKTETWQRILPNDKRYPVCKKGR